MTANRKFEGADPEGERENDRVVAKAEREPQVRERRKRGSQGREHSAYDGLHLSSLIGAVGPVNRTCYCYAQLYYLMLVFRGLVTKDNIWIRAGPSKYGMLLAAQEIKLIVVQGNGTG